MQETKKMSSAAMSDFGESEFPAALVNVTNVCNLECAHCFVFRDSNPNSPRDKMDDATMLRELEALRDKHGIRTMLFMGGEPMIRKDLVFKAMELFDECSIVTNGTYGIPSVPGHVVTVSLDGPEALNDPIRGDGVFQKVKQAVFERDANDGTSVILQMAITKQNEAGIEDFIEEVKDWPISGVAFTFYVPQIDDDTGMSWDDLKERDPIVDRAIAIKKKYPHIVKANVGALELMKSDVALNSTGETGENCPMHDMLPLYMGNGGQFERTFCCYGNEVDCSRCGAYAVFNRHFQRQQGLREGRRWGGSFEDAS
jgi:MoaA/NifB/PqqE/SkfB family radical SAM enzyme